MPNQKPEKEQEATHEGGPSAAKLAAWKHVRDVWKKHKGFSLELLEAEQAAKDTD